MCVSVLGLEHLGRIDPQAVSLELLDKLLSSADKLIVAFIKRKKKKSCQMMKIGDDGKTAAC